jgi:pyruvate,water dikinase
MRATGDALTAPQLVFFFGQGSSEGDPARKDILGGKGASLAAMSRAGFPVPPGFTISAECCAYVEEHGAWPPRLEEQVRAALARLETLTQRTFGHGPRPLLVAVRSGAAVSMPGMMDTLLNVGLNSTDPWSALVQAIDAVFASWHSPRARAYRQHHDVRGVPGTAATVQAMFPSQRSGVLFTANPNDPAAAEMVLEASWGLGEAVVSGAVTPDIYVLDARTLALKHVTPGQRPGNEPALSDEQIHDLAMLGRKVEEYFGAPSDIEWGLADGQIVLLQTRPIRGLNVLADVERGRLEEIARLKQLAGRERVVWAAHNLGETLPTPTPLTWDVVREMMSGRGGLGLLYRKLGYRPSEIVDRDGFLELICGRIYADPRRAAGLFWGALPYEYGTEDILADPQALDGPPRRMNFQRADPFLFARLPGVAWSMLRCAARMKRMRRNVAEEFDKGATPLESLEQDWKLYVERDTAGLLDVFDLHRRRVTHDVAAWSLLPGFFGGLALQELTAWLTRLMGDEGHALVQQLTSGLDDDITVQQNIELYRVSRGEMPISTFLARFGHRAANEMELAQPRWREDPSFLERMIDVFRAGKSASPEERHAQQVAVRHDAEAALPHVLAGHGGSCFREQIESLVREAQRLLPYREKGKFYLMARYEDLRRILVELGRRWNLGRDVFFLHLEELPQFESRESELRDAIDERKVRWQSAQKLVLSEVIDSRNLDSLGVPPPVQAGAHRLPARPIASGMASGIARVVFEPGQAADLGTGYILVCPSTDPGWTPLFVHARGLVVERGGVLSHGAIVARDFGIPAVVCEGATRLIPDGARIQVDGQRGEIVMS